LSKTTKKKAELGVANRSTRASATDIAGKTGSWGCGFSFSQDTWVPIEKKTAIKSKMEWMYRFMIFSILWGFGLQIYEAKIDLLRRVSVERKMSNFHFMRRLFEGA